MGLFSSRRPQVPDLVPGVASQAAIPVGPVDLDKRYDVYCSAHGEERVYEDVRFLGIRTFDRLNSEFSSGLVGGFLEIEARDGSRLLIPSFGIQLLCEHGTRPAYKVTRRWGDTVDY
jgi:hypothetical protein